MLRCVVQEEVTVGAKREADMQSRITLLSHEAQSAAGSQALLDALTARQEAASAALRVSFQPCMHSQFSESGGTRFAVCLACPEQNWVQASMRLCA